MDGRLFREVFGSRWIVLRAARLARHPELGQPPFTAVYRDASAALFRID